MRFRVTKEEDLPAVMTILHQAQAYFKAHGIDQWQDGYPDEATLRRDIQNGTAYVAELDGAVAACATIAFAPDENYTTMVSGQWLTERPYAVIHRIAVDDKLKGQGIAGWILEQAEADVPAAWGREFENRHASGQYFDAAAVGKTPLSILRRHSAASRSESEGRL